MAAREQRGKGRLCLFLTLHTDTAAFLFIYCLSLTSVSLNLSLSTSIHLVFSNCPSQWFFFLSFLWFPNYLIALPSICSSVGAPCPHYSPSVFFNPFPFPLVILLSSFFSFQALSWTLSQVSLSPFTPLLLFHLPGWQMWSETAGLIEVWSSTHTYTLIYTTKPRLQMQRCNMATRWQERLLPQQHVSAWQHSLAMATSRNIYISCRKIIFVTYDTWLFY